MGCSNPRECSIEAVLPGPVLFKPGRVNVLPAGFSVQGGSCSEVRTQSGGRKGGGSAGPWFSLSSEPN